jgi:hypothetical protein
MTDNNQNNNHVITDEIKFLVTESSAPNTEAYMSQPNPLYIFKTYWFPPL